MKTAEEFINENYGLPKNDFEAEQFKEFADLMEEYAEAKAGHVDTIVMRTGYLCEIGVTKTFVIADNVASAMDCLERTSNGEDYSMIIHHSIPVIVQA